MYYYVALPKTKLVTLYFKKCRKNSASLNYSMGVGGMTKKSYIRTHVWGQKIYISMYVPYYIYYILTL